MTVALLVTAALIGYGAGSISFARLIGRIATPGESLDKLTLSYDEGEEVEVVGVSATSLSVRAGRRWGFLVSLLDIGKAALVTAVFRVIAPDDPAYLVAATFAVIGHIWPVWHRFRGGFGVSPLLGGLLVVDPVAILVCIPLGIVIGLAVADRLIVYDGWTLLLIPWFLLIRGDVAATVYAAIVVLLYWWSMRVEVRSHIGRLRHGPNDRRSRLADVRKGYTGDSDVG